MKTKIKFLVILIFYVSNIWGQNGIYFARGKINNKYPISVGLLFYDDGLIKGSMFYDKVGKFISLEGKVLNKFYNEVGELTKVSLTFKEVLPDGTITGIYTGEMLDLNNNHLAMIKGKWETADGKRKYDFYLKRQKNMVIKDSLDINVLDTFFTGNEIYITQYSVSGDYPKLTPLEEPTKKIINYLFGTTDYYNLHKYLEEKYSSKIYREENWTELFKKFPVMNTVNSRDLKICYATNNILAICVYNYSYEGGAHGMDYFFTAHFDLMTGDTLGYYDIFTISKRQMANLIVIPKIEEKQDEYSFLYDDWRDYADKFEFYFTDSGIVFTFNKYVITPYVAVPPEVFASFDELKNYFTNKIYNYLFEDNVFPK